MFSRRTLIATQSAGLFLALSNNWLRPLGAQTSPLAPWAVAPNSDPRLNAMGWAVLAPNPHNRQPWLVRLEGADSLTLYVDLDRRLPVTDPLDRQILIGLGCFAEQFRIAASAQGLEAQIIPFPEGEPQPRLDARPIARITLRPGAAADPLFAAVPQRRSSKQPYDLAREVPQEALATLRSALLSPVGFGARAGDIAAIRDLVWRAWMIEVETPAAHLESVNLMRLGSPAVATNPDGISIWGPQFDPAVAQGVITHAAMLQGGEGYGMMTGMYRAMLSATNAYVWLTTPGNSRAEQFAAGRDWVRLNLAATASGLALHPVSQALPEYPEMDGPRAALAGLLGADSPIGGQVQMLGRLGHPTRPAAPTPRWPAESRIRRG